MWGTEPIAHAATTLILAARRDRGFRLANRDVALKYLPDLFARDPDRLARFTREAQALAALDQCNKRQVTFLPGSHSEACR